MKLSPNSEEKISHILAELRGKRWLSRGLSKSYGSLIPSIDRDGRDKLSRSRKLSLERQSIDIFQSTARYFATPDEALVLKDEFISLFVLRHYGVPTRLLDWSLSPYVAAYFAACDHPKPKGCGIGGGWNPDSRLNIPNSKYYDGMGRERGGSGFRLNIPDSSPP
jgi:FRG domain